MKVVVFHECGLFVAQCLGVDIKEQGKTFDRALQALDMTMSLSGHGRVLCDEDSEDPAPDYYYEIFNQGQVVKRKEYTWISEIRYTKDTTFNEEDIYHVKDAMHPVWEEDAFNRKFYVDQLVTHVKTQGKYRILTHATIEATLEPAYVYRAEPATDPGKVWVRPASEMEDGRFIADVSYDYWIAPPFLSFDAILEAGGYQAPLQFGVRLTRNTPIYHSLSNEESDKMFDDTIDIVEGLGLSMLGGLDEFRLERYRSSMTEEDRDKVVAAFPDYTVSELTTGEE